MTFAPCRWTKLLIQFSVHWSRTALRPRSSFTELLFLRSVAFSCSSIFGFNPFLGEWFNYSTLPESYAIEVLPDFLADALQNVTQRELTAAAT